MVNKILLNGDFVSMLSVNFRSRDKLSSAYNKKQYFIVTYVVTESEGYYGKNKQNKQSNIINRRG